MLQRTVSSESEIGEVFDMLCVVCHGMCCVVMTTGEFQLKLLALERMNKKNNDTTDHAVCSFLIRTCVCMCVYVCVCVAA